MGGILGGSKQKSTSTSNSSNRAYDTLNTAFSPLLGYASEGAKGISSLLGGDTSGFEKYKTATGFNDELGTGLENITGASAAKGLLRSGSTSRGLQAYGTQLQNQYSNNYLEKLLGLAGLGNTAGGILSGAGNVSNGQTDSSGKSKKGIGGILGSVAGSVAMSDRRVKKNIKKVGEFSDGLGKYTWSYVWDDDDVLHEGVMADEVATLRPWALGPKMGEYATVDYGRL